MSDDKKIVKLNEYRNRGKVIQFPKDRTHTSQEEFDARIARIKESLNRINKLYQEFKEDKKKD